MHEHSTRRWFVDQAMVSLIASASVTVSLAWFGSRTDLLSGLVTVTLLGVLPWAITIAAVRWMVLHRSVSRHGRVRRAFYVMGTVLPWGVPLTYFAAVDPQFRLSPILCALGVITWSLVSPLVKHRT